MGFRFSHWGRKNESDPESRNRAGSGVEVQPADVVRHGATHLHALGSDCALVHRIDTEDGRGARSLTIESLDVPVVSAGLLSPFPTPSTNDSATILGWITEGGWRYNLQNNIWNTNYPQVQRSRCTLNTA